MKSERINRLRAENLVTRAVLCATFPNAFFPKGAAKRPLKIGIFQDIIALGADISKRKLRQALRDYTGGPLYLKALKAGEHRIDLDGYNAGFVTEDHAAHAAKELAAINARKARKAHRRHDEKAAA